VAALAHDALGCEQLRLLLVLLQQQHAARMQIGRAPRCCTLLLKRAHFCALRRLLAPRGLLQLAPLGGGSAVQVLAHLLPAVRDSGQSWLDAGWACADAGGAGGACDTPVAVQVAEQRAKHALVALLDGRLLLCNACLGALGRLW